MTRLRKPPRDAAEESGVVWAHEVSPDELTPRDWIDPLGDWSGNAPDDVSDEELIAWLRAHCLGALHSTAEQAKWTAASRLTSERTQRESRR
jgi:uncharacterized protein YecA (UPF0149 family)